MKGAVHGYDLLPTVVERSQLHSILVSLGTGVTHEQPVAILTRETPEFFGQLLLYGYPYGVGIETYLGELSFEHLHIMRVCVAYGYHGMAAVHIQVLYPLGVPHLRPQSLYYLYVVGGIYVEHFHIYNRYCALAAQIRLKFGPPPPY